MFLRRTPAILVNLNGTRQISLLNLAKTDCSQNEHSRVRERNRANREAQAAGGLAIARQEQSCIPRLNMTTALRVQSSQPPHSPTSSISSQTTTPTSPHFVYHAQAAVARYASIQPHPYASIQASPDSRGTTPIPQVASNASLPIQHPRPPTPPLLQTPSNQTFSAYLRSWGNTEMASFLALYRCGHYASAFHRNDIDGKVLLDLDMSSLKEIGVAKVGERVKLLAGIKDLRKRSAASGPIGSSRVELRLNGAATPPLEDGEPLSPPADDRSRVVTPQERLTGSRRLNNSRPPPLDLQPHFGSRPLPQAYQNHLPSAKVTTPRPLARPTQSSSSTTSGTSVPGPSRPSNGGVNLRPPPSRDASRRSPSPSNTDVSNFVDRPLPPAPREQSSAAEYATSVTQQRQATTPNWAQSDHQYGLPRGPAPTLADRRAAQPQVVTARGEHRKAPSTGTPSKQISPIKSKFSAMMGRPSTSTGSGNVHPFAANRTREDDLKPSSSNNLDPNSAANRRNLGGFVVGSAGMLTGKTSSTDSRTRKDTVTNPLNQSQLALEDIRRQVVKFINKEDGTTRTVNVASCSSGVEVLERVLKKFGKWNTGTSVSTDGDSDEDGDRLEVDGWGVYAESDPDDDGECGIGWHILILVAKPLSEASLLGICLSHRDGSAIREKGLLLRRTRRPQQHRKNMEVFFGEAPPPPMSPASPTYGGPRLGFQETGQDLLTPSKASRSKKMNRASTVSVMSGLGVPMAMSGDAPPSPGIRSSSSSSFLANKGRKMYNFFGHRPPSELIANHLGEYFPSAKKKELEKSRHSMMRMSMAPNARGSFETDRRSSMVSPPRKGPRPISKVAITSPAPAATIPEEGEVDSELLPRVSVSTDGGMSVRPRIDGESDMESIASVESRPPLLPPFEPSKESLSDSLGAYSPTITTGPPPKARPVSVVLGRRVSAGSNKSRVSMLSQLRRNRDRSDNASLLTVDEITAGVEHRRASTITFDESSDEEAPVAAPPVVDPGLVPQSEMEEDSDADEEESEEDSEDESEDDEEEDEEEDEQGKAFTSTGCQCVCVSWETSLTHYSTDLQMDQRRSYRSWIFWFSVPGYGRTVRSSHGCQTGGTSNWLS